MTYPRTTYPQSREATKEGKLVRDGPIQHFWSDLVVLMTLKIPQTPHPIFPLVKVLYNLRMATPCPIEMARQSAYKCYQVNLLTLPSQKRLNQCYLIQLPSLDFQIFQNRPSTINRQIRPQKLQPEMSRLLLYLKNYHPADQTHHPVAHHRPPKLCYEKPNVLPRYPKLGHRAGTSE
jgi:hypothetical protein